MRPDGGKSDAPAHARAAGPDRIAAEAVEWIVALSADDAAERARAEAGFAHWKGADPRHAEVAARLQGLLAQTRMLRGDDNTDTTGGAPVQAAHAALQATQAQARRQRRRRAASLLLALAVLAPPAWLGLQHYRPSYLLADVRTGTGKWHSRTLADGSRLTVGSGSAVNLYLGSGERRLELVRGELLVDVAHDSSRPFLVQTADGSVRALGTRFVVRRDGAGTTVTMLESRTLVQPAQQPSTAGAVLDAGQRLHFDATKIGTVESIDSRSVDDAWKHHQLVARGSSLSEVLDELARHRSGHIAFDRARMDQVKVYAVLPLDDTDRALQLLGESLPQLKVRRFTGYLVVVQ